MEAYEARDKSVENVCASVWSAGRSCNRVDYHQGSPYCFRRWIAFVSRGRKGAEPPQNRDREGATLCESGAFFHRVG